MRPQTQLHLRAWSLGLAVVTLAACGGRSNQSQSSSTAIFSPRPLRACETRELILDGTDLILQSNIDGSLASITIVHAPDNDALDRSIHAVRKSFGDPHRDTRTTTHQSKWGLPQVTDACGRVVIPSAAPSPA